MSMTPASLVVPQRVLLSGVPRVHFYQGGASRCPEDFTFPSCLRAALEFLGHNLGCLHVPKGTPGWGLNCAYAYLVGASGNAFSLVWNDGWDPGNTDIRWIAADPAEPMRRALEAAGCSGQVLLREQGHADEGVYRDAIITSLRDQGRPVLALGVVGPPECCLITGYDEGGDVLMGWSFFQDVPGFAPSQGIEPTGEFRQGDWFAQTAGLIVLGDGNGGAAIGKPPDRHAIYRSTLREAVASIRAPMIHGRHTGLAAYDAWAEHLLRDDAFPTGEPAALRERYDIHDWTVGNVATARWYGSLFLSQMANEEPWMSAELLRAAACMAEEHALMWDAWGLVGGIGWNEERGHKLAEPDTRRAIVEVIGQSREWYAQMADHLEAALAHADRAPA